MFVPHNEIQQATIFKLQLVYNDKNNQMVTKWGYIYIYIYQNCLSSARLYYYVHENRNERSFMSNFRNISLPQELKKKEWIYQAKTPFDFGNL